ncbi:MAG: FkbM family methyltransferase, partial [Cyanobacteria bacterium P01_D01_bin.6]
SQIDTKILYHEMFQMQPYLKHGVQVCDGDCIFDVGANIGLFSLSLTQSFRNLKIFAFEPIPETFNVLKSNAERYFSDTVLCNVGLSNTAKITQFSYSPALSMTASMYFSEAATSVPQKASPYDWMKAIVLDLQRISELNAKLAQILVKILSISGLRSLLFGALALYLNKFFIFETRASKQVNCELKTVSEVMRENHISSIDLLKVDVEGSELDVLTGIEQEDWRKIRQVVVEVHNVNDRVEQIVSMLERHGYRTKVAQEDWAIFRVMDIFMVYAVR